MQSGDKAVPHRYGTCLQILNILLLQLLKDACLKNAGAFGMAIYVETFDRNLH
jgi:hypothetical protein